MVVHISLNIMLDILHAGAYLDNKIDGGAPEVGVVTKACYWLLQYR